MSEAVEPVTPAADVYLRLKEQAEQVLKGQDQVFELLCVAFLTGGHALLEGVPGTAKTLMAKLLARLVSAEFRRVQFTPDLMPSDIIGTNVFDLQTGQFHLKRGPIFTQILLADEINRAPAKTQSALLEAMEERQVTLDGERHPLQFPFFVVATQNPVEYEGTYPLPEAQLDRFLMKIDVGYPPEEAEREVLRGYHRGFNAQDLDRLHLEPVVSPERLGDVMSEIGRVTVDDAILGYVTAIVALTRSSQNLVLGASPRASIALLLCAKSLAALRGRPYVTPDDVQDLAVPVLRHRLIVKPEAEIEGMTPDREVTRLLGRVSVPR